MNIAISSGKGGTGKTFISTNIASALARGGKKVTYLDCDVEEPNGHLFLKPDIEREEEVKILSPSGVDPEKCINCGRCADVCRYNAIALVKDKVLFFNELCHVCGGCTIVCPTGAIVEEERKIGLVRHGKKGDIDVHYALLQTAEGGMSPRLVKKVKECAGPGVNILDSSPGTACPVVETVKEADLCVLVTDPTPFGVNDLKLAVDMCRDIGQEPVIVVNRAEYLDSELMEYCRKEELQIAGEIPDDRRIAETYSTGGMVIEELPGYGELFEDIASRILGFAEEKRPVKQGSGKAEEREEQDIPPERSVQYATPSGQMKPRELVVISGKGGTGKTSIAASFAALANKTLISDCDVDAADLHLILRPEINEKGTFSGGVSVEIDTDRCTACGRCMKACRFSAVNRTVDSDGNAIYSVDPIACEGCGVCALVCPEDAIRTGDAINGEWFISETRFGPMSHAKLGVAEENSGRLVSLVRDKACKLANRYEISEELIDGSPGTGCPVIASLTGADYALIVTEPTVSGIHDMERVFDVTRHFNIPAGVVVNKYDLNKEMTERIKALTREKGCDFMGTVPYGGSVTRAQMKKLSVVEYDDGPVTRAIKDIWRKVSAETGVIRG